jgi:hypothetical protein
LLIRPANNYAAVHPNNRGCKIGSKVTIVVTPSYRRTQQPGDGRVAAKTIIA